MENGAGVNTKQTKSELNNGASKKTSAVKNNSSYGLPKGPRKLVIPGTLTTLPMGNGFGLDHTTNSTVLKTYSTIVTTGSTLSVEGD